MSIRPTPWGKRIEDTYEQQITIKPAGGQSEIIIEKMVRKAELHAQMDQEDIPSSNWHEEQGRHQYLLTKKSLGEYRGIDSSRGCKEDQRVVSESRKCLGILEFINFGCSCKK